MRITVRYFAVLREQRGLDAEDVELPAGATVGDAWTALCPPASAGLRVAFARNRVVAAPADGLSEGDELAFLPPIGGG